MKYHIEHPVRVFEKSRMNIAKLNFINAPLLTCLQAVFLRLYMNYACNCSTLNENERQNRANSKHLFWSVFLMRNFGVNVLL